MHYSDSVIDSGAPFEEWLTTRLRDASAVLMRTGFLSASAVDEIGPLLRDLLSRGGRFVMVAGGAIDQADPEALIRLGEMVDEFGDQAVLRVVTNPEEFQNAKTYHVAFPDGHTEACVGSVNFTRGGLLTNHEAALYLHSRQPGETEIITEVRRGIEAFLDRPGTVPVSGELRLLLGSRHRRAPATRRDARPLRKTQRFEDLLQGTMDEIDAVASSGGRLLGVSTGFPDLDEITNGFTPGTLTVIGSRPSAGKSTLLLDFVRTAAISHSLSTALFHLADDHTTIVERILSAEAKIRLGDMRGGRMSDDDWTRLARKMTEINDAPLRINTTPSADLDRLCDEAAELHDQEPLSLLAIDSLNTIHARAEQGATREREISTTARRLKRLALELHIPILVTTELSKPRDPRTPVSHTRPELADIRESEAISHVADNIILLDRPDTWERDHPRAGEADLVLAKHRNGPTATIEIAHQLHHSRFATLARD